MKLPRDLGAERLIKSLVRYGYTITRQTGSHVRLTTSHKGEHHITIPAHASLRVGTLNGILTNISAHLKKSKEEIVKELFG